MVNRYKNICTLTSRLRFRYIHILFYARNITIHIQGTCIRSAFTYCSAYKENHKFAENVIKVKHGTCPCTVEHFFLWVYCLCGRFSELSEANIQILQTVAPHLSVNGLTSLTEVMVARIISCESEDVMATNGKYRKCETKKFYVAKCLTVFLKFGHKFVHVESQDGGFKRGIPWCLLSNHN